jgi:hypothetical protein
VKILVAIPHFFGPAAAPEHASQANDSARRIRALSTCISSLHQVFGRPQVIGLREQPLSPAGEMLTHEIDVVVCTTGGHHLLDDLPLPAKKYVHHPTDAEPMLLGFECHALLRDALGGYDYYCFLEDDLILHDPFFFTKLIWFTRAVGKDAVLHPNRYEITTSGEIWKAYIDGKIVAGYTKSWQDIGEQPHLGGSMLGQQLEFHRASNPHSGCFFLDAEQMADWAGRPWFLDRDTSFVGPLESAATLGLTRSFRVYKPAAAVAGFLEIQHFGSAHLDAMVEFQKKATAS